MTKAMPPRDFQVDFPIRQAFQSDRLFQDDQIVRPSLPVPSQPVSRKSRRGRTRIFRVERLLAHGVLRVRSELPMSAQSRHDRRSSRRVQRLRDSAAHDLWHRDFQVDFLIRLSGPIRSTTRQPRIFNVMKFRTNLGEEGLEGLLGHLRGLRQGPPARRNSAVASSCAPITMTQCASFSSLPETLAFTIRFSRWSRLSLTSASTSTSTSKPSALKTLQKSASSSRHRASCASWSAPSGFSGVRRL
jgi:hypothetical protein